MKIVVFGPDHRVGALAGDEIVDINRAFTHFLVTRGHPEATAAELAEARTPATLSRFIEAGREALDDARLAVETATIADVPGLRHPAAATRIHAPWPGRRIACAGGNYADHLLGMFRHRAGYENATAAAIAERTRESGQWGFWKVPHEVAGPGDPVVFPSRCTYFDYEGEVAVVLGRRGKDIDAADADSYVWGVTLLNDWSKRDPSTRSPRAMSYNLQKNFDSSTSLGPCIVVGELDWRDIDVETRVNGTVRQWYNTGGMIFGFGEILEYLSADFTMVPGDVIAGGTDAGTAADSTPPGPDGRRALELFLKPGDVVEVGSPPIGLLRNTVVAPH
jgi:2-keto-4-pentenoate hydratase/2-oxohepta-3-ene-1,7-dioic acid hydratase in catechol pathway